MSESIDYHKNRLAESREKLNQALDLIGDRADEQIYSEGAQWTLRQLAIHLALADTGHNRMMYNYAEGKEFIPADYDLERYNKRSVEKKEEMTLAQARELLAQSRAELLEWLDSIEDESILDKTGRHATMKIMSLSEIMDFMAGHEEGHADDIMAMLAPS
jgi:uncharacterized damage-inducible protein DinB